MRWFFFILPIGWICDFKQETRHVKWKMASEKERHPLFVCAGLVRSRLRIPYRFPRTTDPKQNGYAHITKTTDVTVRCRWPRCGGERERAAASLNSNIRSSSINARAGLIRWKAKTIGGIVRPMNFPDKQFEPNVRTHARPQNCVVRWRTYRAIRMAAPPRPPSYWTTAPCRRTPRSKGPLKEPLGVIPPQNKKMSKYIYIIFYVKRLKFIFVTTRCFVLYLF